MKSRLPVVLLALCLGACAADEGNRAGDGADSGAGDAAQQDGGAGDGAPEAGPQAKNLEVLVNRDVDPAPTPINKAYVEEISATSAGDHIVSLQKYFRSEPITTALLDAARRGVTVETVYMQDVDPTCESLLTPEDTIDCSALFRPSFLSHHKNMMIRRQDGSLRAIVGSYNLRVRSMSSPRVHTVLTFDVADGQPVFDWYLGAAERMLSGSTSQPVDISLPTDSGGELSLSITPAPFNAVLDMLKTLPGCDGILWMSYFGASDDATGGPVFDELERLMGGGCDVRVLLDEENTLARTALENRGVPARFPTFPAGSATLGHKIVLADAEGETHFLQSSANLTALDVIIGNLTAYLRAPTTPEIREAIETELLRYW